MAPPYASRNRTQGLNLTESVIAGFDYKAICAAMLDKAAFLMAVETAAPSRADMARKLDLPAARITEMYKGERDLRYDEAVKLARAYGLEAESSVSASELKAVLAVCLRHAPKGGWSDRDVERLAQEIEYGLSLLRSFETSPPSQDAMDLAERVIADRLRDTRD